MLFFGLLFTFPSIITDLSAPVMPDSESAWFPEEAITITTGALFKHSMDVLSFFLVIQFPKTVRRHVLCKRQNFFIALTPRCIDWSIYRFFRHFYKATQLNCFRVCAKVASIVSYLLNNKKFYEYGRNFSTSSNQKTYCHFWLNLSGTPYNIGDLVLKWHSAFFAINTELCVILTGEHFFRPRARKWNIILKT